MEAPDFLPLGSIVVTKGSTKKIMIIARGLAVTQAEGPRYYDYGACLYPEGLIGDQVIYFNHEVINKVFFEGYTDDDEALAIENITEGLKYVTLEKGDPQPYLSDKAQ